MKKICTRCSTSFGCRQDRVELCKCSHTSLTPGTKDYIKDNYDDCLCPNCLKEISSSYNSMGVNPKYLRAVK